MNHSKVPVCILVRVSTQKQDYQRQIAELTDYANAKQWEIVKVIATKVSGANILSKRLDLDELLASANRREFSKVVVLETSRLGRVAKDIRSTLDALHSKGISVVFKNIGGLESLHDGKESFVTNVIISIYSELAQEERRILIERINSGLEQAKKNGKVLGRKNGTTESDLTFLKKYTKLTRD